MTVHQGPFNSVYAGHAALHAIDTGLILTLSYSLPVSIFLLSGSLPVYSCTIRLTAIILRLAACLVLRYQAHILSLSGLLHVYSHSQACCHLFSHSHSGSLPIYSHSIRLAACLFSHYQLLIYSLALTQACCLSILTLTQARCLSILTLTQARCLSILTLTQARCLSILTLTQARCLSILTLTQARCLSSLTQARCLSILTLTQARCLSILTLSGSLSIYSHTHVTVYLFSHPMLLKHSCSLAHQCIRAHSRAHCLSILIQATYLVPHPDISFQLSSSPPISHSVCCLATARLTTNVLSCLSSICSYSYCGCAHERRDKSRVKVEKKEDQDRTYVCVCH